MEHVLRAYAELWSEPDGARREELLDLCWSEESEIVGPGYHFKGKKSVLAEAARFQKDEPGHRIVLTSAFDWHGNWARFTFALLAPDGRTALACHDLTAPEQPSALPKKHIAGQR
jgi:uncharacterized protein YndB with AHSA1/START domain